MEDFFFISITISLVFLFFAYKFYYHINPINRKKLPPSPPSLPIIGHFHILAKPLHRSFHELSKKYGPVFSLKLGSTPVVVVTSSLVAEECFTKNDVVLANRPRFLIGKHIGYNYTNITAAPYGDHWRNLRKVSAEEIFSVARLNVSQFKREDEVKHLLLRLSKKESPNGSDFAKVEMRSLFKDLMLNNIMRMVAGKRYYGDGVAEKKEAAEFTALMDDLFKYGAGSNPADALPFLKWVTFGKITKGLERLGTVADKFMQSLVDEHENNKKNKNKAAAEAASDSMVDHLLSLQRSNPDYYTDEIIKGLLLTIIVTGTDTSYSTMGWALADLVNHPDVLEKARHEVDSRVGQDRLINEKDVPDLPYLQNILLEVSRLHPVTPLLIPHYSSGDCTIGGYDVPPDTIVFVNAWAIHRDPTLWDDPESFKPERFESDIAQSRKLLTFGMGRRACPGAGLAQRMIGLTLGSLIQCFEWERTDEALVDMTEGAGVVMPRAKPLEVMCKPRPIVSKVLSI